MPNFNLYSSLFSVFACTTYLGPATGLWICWDTLTLDYTLDCNLDLFTDCSGSALFLTGLKGATLWLLPCCCPPADCSLALDLLWRLLTGRHLLLLCKPEKKK